MKRRSKYGAIRTAVDGKVFASKREANRYLELKMLAKANEIEKLELQPRFKLIVSGIHIATYVADFQYICRKTGERVTEDCKGFKTPVYRIKKKLVKAIHGIDVVEV